MAKNTLDGIKSRVFMLLLYPGEDKTHSIKKIEKKCKVKGWELCYIVHNKDKYTEDEVDENSEHKAGDKKKSHVHMVIRWTYGNQIRRASVAAYLGIEKNYIEPCGNTKAALRYLMHLDNPEKHQYDFSCVKGSDRLRGILYQTIENEEPGLSPQEFISILSHFINSRTEVISTEDVLLFSFEYGCEKVYKTYQFAIHRMIDEHNFKYRKLAQNMK